MEDNKELLNWEGLDLYTKDFKEWLFKLLHKIHARIGHVEEDLYKVKQQQQASYTIKKRVSPSGAVIYSLVNNTNGESCGDINIETNGVVVSTWKEELNV